MIGECSQLLLAVSCKFLPHCTPTFKYDTPSCNDQTQTQINRTANSVGMALAGLRSLSRFYGWMGYDRDIIVRMGADEGSIQVAEEYIPYMAASSATALLLLVLLIVYRCKYHPSAPIIAILGLLLFNDMLQIGFELATYLSSPPQIVCLVSVVGTTFFRLASYYWLIFISKLIYREKASPGREVNLKKQVGKNLVMAYLPSIVVSLLVIIVSNLDSTQSKNNCWKIIREKEPIDYIIFLLSFVFPNLVALVLIMAYLLAYLRLKPKKHSIFLWFPTVAIPFLLYGLTLKMLSFFSTDVLSGNGELPLMVQPLTHAVIFMVVLRKISVANNPNMSEVTLGEDPDSLGLEAVEG